MANAAKNWWRRYAGWVIGLKNRLKSRTALDLFAAARLKIAFWYAVIGIVILGVGGYLVYAYIIFIVGDIIRIIQQLLEANALESQSAGTTIITHAINGDLVKMSIAVGIWIVFTMILSAYVLAEIILWPIRRAVERQRRFIANVSHELRTPLSVMRTNADVALLGGEQADPKELLETIRSNREEIDRMTKITQFLMSFSNMQRHMTKEKLAPVDLVDVAEKAVKSMKGTAAKRDVSLRFATNERPAKVRGSVTALEEMVTNLLKNAISYTPAGGTIVVNVTKRDSLRAGAVTLAVADTGVGIPPKDLPNIFDAFYRGEGATKGQKGAHSGLGLAIVKEIASLHSAAISVKSKVGEGTRISVRFPAFS